MQPLRQSSILDNKRLYLIVLLLVVNIIILSTGYTRYRRRGLSARAVTPCVADSSVHLLQCGYTDDCIFAVFKCDDVIDCDDGSDESEATCKGVPICESTEGPHCPENSTCRSEAASETRLAHHVCDCKSNDCLTTAAPLVITAPTQSYAPSGGETYPGVPAHPTTVPSVTTEGATEGNIVTSLDSMSTKTSESDPDVGYSTQDTTPVITSSLGTIRTHAPTSKNAQTLTPSGVTRNVDIPTSLEIAPSTPQGTRHDASTAVTSHGSVSGDTMSTKPSAGHAHETAPPTSAGSDLQNGSPTKQSSGTPEPADESGNSTGVMVVVFGLMALIPLAIMFHCLLKQNVFSLAGRKESTDQGDSDPSQPQSDGKAESKQAHRRNVSISSIVLKENSTLLGNEVPVDLNMNVEKQASVLPVIRITPPPDEGTESPRVSVEGKRTTSRRRPDVLPDTKIWFPDNGSDEPLYFVTDSNPLPVSIV